MIETLFYIKVMCLHVENATDVNKYILTTQTLKGLLINQPSLGKINHIFLPFDVIITVSFVLKNMVIDYKD